MERSNTSTYEVIVTSGKDINKDNFMNIQRQKVCNILLEGGFNSKIDYSNTTLVTRLNNANDNCIHYVILVNDYDIENGIVTIMNMVKREKKNVTLDKLICSLSHN